MRTWTPLRWLARRSDGLTLGGPARTRVQLAAAAGTAGPYVSDMERGIKVPSLTTIIRLAIALDCKVTNLVRVFDRADLPALVK